MATPVPKVSLKESLSEKKISKILNPYVYGLTLPNMHCADCSAPAEISAYDPSPGSFTVLFEFI